MEVVGGGSVTSDGEKERNRCTEILRVASRSRVESNEIRYIDKVKEREGSECSAFFRRE